MKKSLLAALILAVASFGCTPLTPAQTTQTVSVYRGAYSSGTTYAVGNIVTSGGVTYVSLVASNTGNSPGSSPSDWQVLGMSVGSTNVATCTGAQTVTLAPGWPVYDVTLSANCTITIATTAGLPSTLSQGAILILRPSGYTVTLPSSSSSLKWFGGAAPYIGGTSLYSVNLFFSGTLPVLGR